MHKRRLTWICFASILGWALYQTLHPALPQTQAFQGVLYRFVHNDWSGTSWEITEYNRRANHRYTPPGVGAIYACLEKAGALAEMEHYKLTEETHIIKQKHFCFPAVLDLTNPKTIRAVSKHVPFKEEELTSNCYEVSQKVGIWAKENGFNVLLVPSARLTGGTNIVIYHYERDPAHFQST